MTSRLFIALEIPDTALRDIISLRDEIYGVDSKIKWEPVEKLHITLKFLGDVEEELIGSIFKNLDLISQKYNQFECEFKRFGLFYRNNSPRILWIGTAANEKLTILHKVVDDSMERLGFEKETRKFKSHLTLLRVKGNENRQKLEKFRQVEFKPIKFRARNIELIKSELKPAGSVYSVIKSFNLN